MDLQKAPTIRDVARKAGISVATVSYILNGKSGKYSQETCDRIRAVMLEMGYEPNFTAKSLASGRSQLIGLVLPSSMRDPLSGASASPTGESLELTVPAIQGLVLLGK